MTMSKAIAAFLGALVALFAAAGYAQDWATPSLIDAVSAVLGALFAGAVTYFAPANKPKA